MHRVHFGEDYNSQFDTKACLSDFFKEEDDKIESYNGFALRGLHEFWSKMAAKKIVRVLDFGGGPAIYDLISSALYVEEIIFGLNCRIPCHSNNILRSRLRGTQKRH